MTGARTKAVRALIDAADAASASRIAALLSARRDADHRCRRARPRLIGRRRPVAAATALELLSLLDTFPDRMLVQHEVNGAAGIVIRSHDRVVGVISIAMRASTITQIWAVVNPDKLAHWNRDLNRRMPASVTTRARPLS